MTKEPFIILLVIFVLVGLAYGPSKKYSGQNEPSYSTIGPTQNLNTSGNKNLAEEIKKTEKTLAQTSEELKEAARESRRSPYYEKVRLSNIYSLGDSDPSREYISLSVYLDQNETLKITGWVLKSEITGYYAIIGKAALLPFPFTKNESNVVLQKNDRVYIIKGFSPIGISFRTNKCTGYFEENRTFYPSLDLKCPRASEEQLPTFSSVYDRNEECLDIIDRISRCTTKGSSFFRDLPDTVPSLCKNYIEAQVNYNACVAKHFGDTDFPDNEYYIYLNKFGALWRESHDTINLHDENGLIVDTISY